MQSKIEQVLKIATDIITKEGISIKDLYPEDLLEHSTSVASLGVALGIQYNLNLQELIDIATGGLLHDIGKVYITDDIIYKDGSLDSVERQLIQAHPSIGLRTLREYNFNKNVLNIVDKHHESVQGTGYPSSTTNVNILVQIISVSDHFDAVQRKRCYHAQRSLADTMQILKEDDSLNQVIVYILDELIKEYPELTKDRDFTGTRKGISVKTYNKIWA